MAKQRLFCSFSGGLTSATMAEKLNKEYSDRFEIINGIANTAEEDQKTLTFADRCDREFGLNLVWIESVTKQERAASGHRVVEFISASRRGEPYEKMIAKYGIPNKTWPHCTRELKLNPIRSYLESIGWEKGSYLTAVGIRADEPRRIRKDAEKANIVYPMAHWFPMTKRDVNEHWESMPFTLGLEEHQGNCRWCWKKSLTKLVRLAKEDPQIFDFPARMERDYAYSGYNADGNPRVFFRSKMSTIQLLELASHSEVRTINDQDQDSGCSESCEAFGEPEEFDIA